VIFKVQFGTSFGRFDFYWRGGRIVEIYQGEDSTPKLMNPFNLEAGRLPFRSDLASFKDFCRWHLWEMERGIEIYTMVGEEVFAEEHKFKGNESPS